MKITIDEKTCQRHKMSFEEFLIALTHRSVSNYDKVLQNLLKREILVSVNGEYLVTQRWSDVIDEILCDSQGCQKTDVELLELAKKMRDIYPPGKVPGSPYLYKCNPREIMLKLKKFFITYGQYSDDDILDATRRYVASFKGDYKYLKLLKYFISKNEDEKDENGEVHKVEHSYLADYLENKEVEEDVVTSDEWTTKMI